MDGARDARGILRFAKRSGAAMCPAFDCSRCGCWAERIGN